MNEKLEKLFSPEKLRKKWEKKPGSDETTTQHDVIKKGHSVMEEFNRTSILILTKYKGDKQDILKILLDDIKKELDAFITTGSEKYQSAEASVSIIEQVNQLEDLIEAF